MATIAEVQTRQETIVSLTNDMGRCSVAEMAHRFKVTPETIRRDLKFLESQNLLTRVHGGAVSGTMVSNSDLLADDDDDIEIPVHQSQRRKQSIAEASLPLIPSPHASMFIDAGSTTETFANILSRNYLGQEWSVVTNSPNVARTLASSGAPRVNILGGIVKGRTQATVGEPALEELRKLRADIALIGTSGLSLDAGLTTSDVREAEIKRMMIEQSHVTVLLCDSAKIGYDSSISFSEISAIDYIVTDRYIEQKTINDLESFNTKVVIP